MQKIFLAFAISTLSLSAHTGYSTERLVNLALGTTCGVVACYSAGETLVDCGHRYHELRKVYGDYVQEITLLDPDHRVTTLAEKRFWAVNQMVSRVPKVFWREIASGSFSIFMGVVAKNYLGKSYA